MRPFVLAAAPIILLSCAASAAASVEDEAHRLDRLETKRLNERATEAMQRAARPSATPSPRQAETRKTETGGEAALRQREMEAIAAWRRHSEQCARTKQPGC